MIIQFSSGEESLGRYLALVSSIGSWLGGVEWKKYGDYSHHLTLPGSGLPIYLNGTSATFNAVLGNLAAVGLSKSGWPFFKDRSTLKARPARYREVWNNSLVRDIGTYCEGSTRFGTVGLSALKGLPEKRRTALNYPKLNSSANTKIHYSVLHNYLMLTARVRTERVSLS